MTHWAGRWLVLVLAAGLAAVSAVGSPAGAFGMIAATDGRSPAQGHAAVIAQGVEPMPRVPVAWRVASFDVTSDGVTPATSAILSFLLAHEGPVLVAETESGAETRLAPGEALAAREGSRYSVTSLLSGQSAATYQIDLVASDDLADAGEAEKLYASDDFAAPRGARDIDLLRDVLEPGESTGIEAPDAPILLLATEGSLRVTGADGNETTLRRGAAAAIAGPLVVKATGSRQAAFVAAVIGADTTPVEASSAPDVTPTLAVESDPTGVIGVAVYLCPPGMGVELLDPAECVIAPVDAGYAFALSGEGLPRTLTIADAPIDGDRFIWLGLPYGQYHLEATVLPPGYDAYFIPGSAAVGGSPDTGYTVTIDESAPDITLTVYTLALSAADVLRR